MDFRAFFDEIKTIAVVGYSDKAERAGHYVPAYLDSNGYSIISVNPKFGDEVDGHANYASLSDIPLGTQVDVIDVFRAPPHVPGLARQAAGMEPKPKYFVMQPGAESDEAAEIAEAAGIVQLKTCLMAEHRML